MHKPKRDLNLVSRKIVLKKITDFDCNKGSRITLINYGRGVVSHGFQNVHNSSRHSGRPRVSKKDIMVLNYVLPCFPPTVVSKYIQLLDEKALSETLTSENR